jgi:L-rhamnose-H+ transport protein
MDYGLVSGPSLLQGVFALPVKYAFRWNYENIWFVYSLAGMVLFPWLLIIATVPQPGRVYALTSSHTLFTIAGFGACRGIGATLTGVGLSILGIGLGMAIIFGLSTSFGSLKAEQSVKKAMVRFAKTALRQLGSA